MRLLKDAKQQPLDGKDDGKNENEAGQEPNREVQDLERGRSSVLLDHARTGVSGGQDEAVQTEPAQNEPDADGGAEDDGARWTHELWGRSPNVWRQWRAQRVHCTPGLGTDVNGPNACRRGGRKWRSRRGGRPAWRPRPTNAYAKPGIVGGTAPPPLVLRDGSACCRRAGPVKAQMPCLPRCELSNAAVEKAAAMRVAAIDEGDAPHRVAPVVGAQAEDRVVAAALIDVAGLQREPRESPSWRPSHDLHRRLVRCLTSGVSGERSESTARRG